jgi:hypothetical protein
MRAAGRYAPECRIKRRKHSTNGAITPTAGERWLFSELQLLLPN